MSEQLDISRILFTIFDGLETEGMPRADVVRLWSLEMQWFSPKEAERVVDALSEAGWMSQDQEMLNLTSGVELEIPSLGWRPMTRRMLSPPTCEVSPTVKPHSTSSEFSQPRVSSRKENEDESIVEKSFSRPQISKSVSESTADSVKQSMPADRAEGSIPILIELIATQSGLDNKEVVRRAQRKRRALGPVTLWMALALVAREQGLDMRSVSSAIDKAAK